jgi:hypothetical protein
MSENHDEVVARAAHIETRAHEHRTGAASLKLRQNGHGRKAHCRKPVIGSLDPDWREKDVADDPVLERGDQRDGTGSTTKRVHQGGLGWLSERALVHDANRVDV